jgi:hypothetical protein
MPAEQTQNSCRLTQVGLAEINVRMVGNPAPKCTTASLHVIRVRTLSDIAEDSKLRPDRVRRRPVRQQWNYALGRELYALEWKTGTASAGRVKVCSREQRKRTGEAIVAARRRGSLDSIFAPPPAAFIFIYGICLKSK